MAVELQHHRQRVRRVLVVVDDQYAPRRDRDRRRVRFARRRTFDQRNVELETRAAAGSFAEYRDVAAMHLDEALDDAKADAETALRAIERAIALHEEIEYARLQLGRDADAIVADRDQRAAAVFAHFEMDLAAAIAVLHRIGQHVRDALHETRRIAVDAQRALGRRRELLRLLPDQRLDHLDGLRDDVAKLDGLALQLDASARDARNVEQIVDEPRQPVDLALHDADGLLGARVVRDQP